MRGLVAAVPWISDRLQHVFVALIATLVNVTGYMAQPWVGFVTTMVTVVYVLARSRWPYLQRLVACALLTMPMYMVPMIPGLHFIASWTTLFLVALTLYTGAKMQRMPAGTFFALFLITSLTAFTYMTRPDTAGGAYYTVQVLLFVFPAVFVFTAREALADQADEHGRRRLINVLGGVLGGMSAGVITQWAAYTFAARPIGSISEFYNRVTFDLTISAYSVLSGILAVGFVVALMLLRRGQPFAAVLLVALTGTGILLNTARTGLAAGLAVLLIALIFPGSGIRAGRVRWLLVPGGLFAWWLVDKFADSSRGQTLGNVLDDNGRYELIDLAFQQLSSDPINLLVGVGYASTEDMAPHNFAAETLLRSGAIVSFVLLIMLLRLIAYLWGTQWQYPLWVLLAASMFFNGTYAVKAAPIIIIAMVLMRASELREARCGSHAAPHLASPGRPLATSFR